MAADIDQGLFWELTLRELYFHIEAAGERQRSVVRMLAWHASTTMGPHVQKKDRSKITPARLLGESTSNDPVSFREKMKQRKQNALIKEGELLP